jgi:hypothetical protein
MFTNFTKNIELTKRLRKLDNVEKYFTDFMAFIDFTD